MKRGPGAFFGTMETIRIETIAHGGDGVGAAADGKRIFVPLTAPGDRVEVRVVDDRGRHARAEVVRLVKPGPERVEPGCPHVGACGGCQLQHLSAKAQLEAKEASFYEALARVGDLPRASIDAARPIVPSPAPLRYRIRCKLEVRGRTAGYLRRRSGQIVAVEGCSLLEPPLEALALRVIAALRERPIAHLASVDLCVGGDGAGAAYLEPAAGAPPGWEARAGDLLRIEGMRGVIAAPGAARGKGRAAPPGQRPAPRIFGDPVVARDAPGAPGMRLLSRPDVFAQANAAANEALVAEAVEALDIAPGDEVLELFCGSGNFTFAIAARGARVTAVEAEGAALSLARLALEEDRRRRGRGERGEPAGRKAGSARGLGAEAPQRPDGGDQRRAPESMPSAGSIRFVGGDASLVAAGFAAEGRRFDRVLLDPPRAGAKGLAPILARLSPARIVYVSCDPPTLARDAKALLASGYRPILARPVDMFPQTFHVEGLLAFERTG
ncbi:MAG TPA: TRAM domain-containing protein [Vulgatibacter sp.]|nr:TRAM domain-containing protein [Vulgatibacter sp.]